VLGPMIATGNFSNAWLYLTAPIIGRLIAAFVHMGLTRLAREPGAEEPMPSPRPAE